MKLQDYTPFTDAELLTLERAAKARKTRAELEFVKSSVELDRILEEMGARCAKAAKEVANAR